MTKQADCLESQTAFLDCVGTSMCPREVEEANKCIRSVHVKIRGYINVRVAFVLAPRCVHAK